MGFSASLVVDRIGKFGVVCNTPFVHLLVIIPVYPAALFVVEGRSMNLYLLLFSCGVFATFPNESIVTLPIDRCVYGDRCLNVTLLPRNFSIQAVLTLSDVFVFNSRIHAIYSSHIRIPNIPDIVSENHLLSSATLPSFGIGPRLSLIHI